MEIRNDDKIQVEIKGLLGIKKKESAERSSFSSELHAADDADQVSGSPQQGYLEYNDPSVHSKQGKCSERDLTRLTTRGDCARTLVLFLQS